MAAAAWDIDTLANVKIRLGIDTTNANRDAILQDIISNVSDHLEVATGRAFKKRDVSAEILNGNGRCSIRPKHIPIYAPYLAASATDAAKLACLQVRDDVDSDWEDVETDVDHIWVNSPALREESANNSHNITLNDATWTEGERTVKISYQCGYDVIPGKIRETFMQMVQWRYDESRAGNNVLGKSSTNDTRGNISSTYADLEERWNKVIEEFKVRY